MIRQYNPYDNIQKYANDAMEEALRKLKEEKRMQEEEERRKEEEEKIKIDQYKNIIAEDIEFNQQIVMNEIIYITLTDGRNYICKAMDPPQCIIEINKKYNISLFNVFLCLFNWICSLLSILILIQYYDSNTTYFWLFIIPFIIHYIVNLLYGLIYFKTKLAPFIALPFISSIYYFHRNKIDETHILFLQIYQCLFVFTTSIIIDGEINYLQFSHIIISSVYIIIFGLILKIFHIHTIFAVFNVLCLWLDYLTLLICIIYMFLFDNDIHIVFKYFIAVHIYFYYFILFMCSIYHSLVNQALYPGVYINKFVVIFMIITACWTHIGYIIDKYIQHKLFQYQGFTAAQSICQLMIGSKCNLYVMQPLNKRIQKICCIMNTLWDKQYGIRFEEKNTIYPLDIYQKTHFLQEISYQKLKEIIPKNNKQNIFYNILQDHTMMNKILLFLCSIYMLSRLFVLISPIIIYLYIDRKHFISISLLFVYIFSVLIWILFIFQIYPLSYDIWHIFCGEILRFFRDYTYYHQEFGNILKKYYYALLIDKEKENILSEFFCDNNIIQIIKEYIIMEYEQIEINNRNKHKIKSWLTGFQHGWKYKNYCQDFVNNGYSLQQIKRIDDKSELIAIGIDTIDQETILNEIQKLKQT